MVVSARCQASHCSSGNIKAPQSCGKKRRSFWRLGEGRWQIRVFSQRQHGMLDMRTWLTFSPQTPASWSLSRSRTWNLALKITRRWTRWCTCCRKMSSFLETRAFLALWLLQQVNVSKTLTIYVFYLFNCFCIDGLITQQTKQHFSCMSEKFKKVYKWV